MMITAVYLVVYGVGRVIGDGGKAVVGGGIIVYVIHEQENY